MPHRIAKAAGYLMSFGGSSAMLAYLHLVAIPRCRELEDFGSRTGACGVSPAVLFLFNAFFLVLIAISGYRLFTGAGRPAEPDEGERSDTFPGDAAARLGEREC